MKNSSGFLVAYKLVLQIGKQENKRFSQSNLKAAYSIAEKTMARIDST
jgi:hypothetical protein